FWTTKNATPGKMVIGATIVDAETGEPPSLKQHVIRYIGYYLSAIIFCLGFIWVGFDRKKQGWHDKLAGTVVVRKKNKGTEPVKFGI
ncbi:RDD family protein, partial [Glaciimonas sp. CA11.2]